jgi:hypothetical protein
MILITMVCDIPNMIGQNIFCIIMTANFENVDKQTVGGQTIESTGSKVVKSLHYLWLVNNKRTKVANYFS